MEMARTAPTNVAPTPHHPSEKGQNPQTYKRMRGADYLAKQGFTVSSGPWTKLESIFLSVVIEVIYGSGVVLNSKNIAELYNFVVSSDKVKEIGIAITCKSLSSTHFVDSNSLQSRGRVCR